MPNKYSDLDQVTAAPEPSDEIAYRDKSNALTASGAVVRSAFSDALKVIHGLTENTAPSELDELPLMDDVSATLAAQRIALWRALSLNKVYVASQVDKTTDTTLALVTGLSVPLAAGGTYAIRAALQVSAGASGGHKYMLASSGGLTATTINYYVQAQTGTNAPVIGSRISDLGSTSAGVTSVFAGLTLITGAIVVDAAGTLQVQFAQNASNSTPSSVLIGSFLEVTRLA